MSSYTSYICSIHYFILYIRMVCMVYMYDMYLVYAFFSPGLCLLSGDRVGYNYVCLWSGGINIGMEERGR